MEYNNKKIVLPKNKNTFLPLIIFSNLFPLYGVLNYNWTIFSVVYIYWIELLIVSFFQFLKIILSKGEPKISFWVNLFLGIKFLLFRGGLFLFYLLFIVVFLGFLVSGKNADKSQSLHMFDVIFLKGSFYKITILSFVLYNLIEFIVLFIANGKYKTDKPSDNVILLDAHIIVVHVVVVLGTFLYKGVTENLNWNHKSAMIACVSLFVVIKIIADVIRQSTSGDIPEEQQEKFI